MNTAIEVSTHSTRKGAALHLRGCGWSRYLPVIQTVELTARNAHRTCKNCRKAIRTAIETAARILRTAARNAYNAARDAALIALGELFATPAEKAHQAELVARLLGTRFAADCGAAEPVKPSFASLVNRLGTTPNASYVAKAAARRAGRRNLQPAA